MIKLIETESKKEIPVKWLEFSDGALSCKILEPIAGVKSYTFYVSPITPIHRILEEICTLLSAMENYTDVDYYILDMPYLPYARAERKFEVGNPIPLQWFLHVLGNLKFAEINIVDPHNDAYKAFYSGKVNVVSQLDALLVAMHDNEDVYEYIVSPDKGASDKALTVVNHCKSHDLNTQLIQATKIRDASNGHIISTVIPDIDLTGCKCLIVDDLMDRGGTFIPLAKKLREAGASQVDLYVTHMIATKGLDLFKDLVDNFYCYQIVQEYITLTDILNFNKRNGENT